MIYTFTLQKLKKEDEIKLKVSKRKEIMEGLLKEEAFELGLEVFERQKKKKKRWQLVR